MANVLPVAPALFAVNAQRIRGKNRAERFYLAHEWTADGVRQTDWVRV